MGIKKNILIEISNQYGLPVYIYDEDKIIEQFQKLENAFSEIENLKIHKAILKIFQLIMMEAWYLLFLEENHLLWEHGMGQHTNKVG